MFLDISVIALDCVALAPGFFVGPGSSKPTDSSSVFTVRRVTRVVVQGLGGGFAGVTGPSDRSLQRGGQVVEVLLELSA